MWTVFGFVYFFEKEGQSTFMNSIWRFLKSKVHFKRQIQNDVCNSSLNQFIIHILLKFKSRYKQRIHYVEDEKLFINDNITVKR